MNKKIICMLFLSIFLISFTSAMDWDNKVSYSEDKKMVNVKNLFGFGKDYADIKIKSHEDLLKPIYINSGDHALIQEIDSKEDYKSFIGGAEFTNMETGEIEELDYYWEKAIYGEVDVEDYETRCEQIKAVNGSSFEKCESVLVGTHKEDKIISWEKFDIHDIKKGEKITLGIVVYYIPPRSTYDVKPILFGKKIEKWALFSNIVVDAHTFPLANVESGQTEFKGFIIEGNDDKTLINVTKKSTVTATRCYFVNSSEDWIGNVSFVGDNADFSSLYLNISNGQQYYVLVGSDGGSFTNYRDTGQSFPQVDTNIDWINGAYWDGSLNAHNGIPQGITQITTGDPIPQVPQLNITLPFPITYSSPQTRLNYTFSNVSLMDSCWYSLDSGDTNSSRVNCGINFTGLSSSEGSNTWTIYGNTTAGALGSGTRTFDVDTTPFIDFVTPTPDDFTNQTSNNFQVNVTLTEDFFQNITFRLINSSGDEASSFFFTDSTRIVNFSNLQDDVYNYSVTTSTNTNKQNTTANRTIRIHGTSPSVNISAPVGNLNFITIGNNLSLNWNVSEEGVVLEDHITSCAYIYNQVETAVNLTDCLETNTTSFLYIEGVNNISFKAVDELGLTTTATSFFNFTIIETSQHFNNQTSEGSVEDFIINITLLDGKAISTGVLNYNSTTQSGTITDKGNNQYSLKSSIVIPSFDTQKNETFWWNITTGDGDSALSSNQTQEVSVLDLDDCSALPVLILNYTIKDEETQAVVDNSTNSSFVEVEVDLSLYVKGLRSEAGLLINFSKFYKNQTNVRVCIADNILNNSAYEMDVLTRYETNGRVSEFHNIQNFSLTNNSVPQHIDLFDLDEDDSTDFLITFKDDSFLKVPDAIIDITRNYISDGVFKTIEIPKTDSNGQTVAHLVRGDIIYTFIIKKQGTILATFSNIIAVCEDVTIGSCNINLNSFTTGDEPTDWDTFGNLDTSLVLDEDTRKLTLTFSTIDGSTSEVQLNGTQFSRLGNTSICSPSLSSSSGTLNCNIADSFGNVTIRAEVYSGGKLITTSFHTISTTPQDVFGAFGLLLVLILVLTIPFMFLNSKEGLVIGSVVGLICASALNIYDGGGIIGVGATILYVIIVAVIFIWRLSTKR